MTARAWIFTLNMSAITDDGVEYTLPDLDDKKNIKYAIYSEEVGDTGTYHLQGYIELTRPVRLSYMKKIEGLERAHFEIRRGTPEQARAYCMKTDDPTFISGPYEFGEFRGQGARTDWLALKEDLKSEKPLQDIWENHFSLMVRYSKGIIGYQSVLAVKRDWKTEVIFLYGPAGTGKSSYIKETSPNCYWKSRSNWWDGYDGKADVSLDDFYGWLPYDFMLRAMDRYPLKVEIKGATIEFAPKRMFITSNKLPHEWWDSEKVPYYHEAFYRRIDRIIYMPKFGKENWIEYSQENFSDFSAAHGTRRNLV